MRRGLVRPVIRSQAQNTRVLSSSAADTYTEKQSKTGRPVSPHVTIYAFPVTALSSITNRVTGAALTVGTTGIGALSLVGVDVASLASTIGSSAIGPLAKFAVGFPLVYHYVGGLRHVMWDRSPEMLTNESVERTSYMVFGGSTAISIGLMFM